MRFKSEFKGLILPEHDDDVDDDDDMPSNTTTVPGQVYVTCTSWQSLMSTEAACQQNSAVRNAETQVVLSSVQCSACCQIVGVYFKLATSNTASSVFFIPHRRYSQLYQHATFTSV